MAVSGAASSLIGYRVLYSTSLEVLRTPSDRKCTSPQNLLKENSYLKRRCEYKAKASLIEKGQDIKLYIREFTRVG